MVKSIKFNDIINFLQFTTKYENEPISIQTAHKIYKIYTILKQGNEAERLSEAIIKFPNFFGRDFPSINLLKNLTYFEDGDLNRLTKKEKAFLVNTVEKVDANKIIEAQRRELQLKAIGQFKANKTAETLNKNIDRER